MLNEVVMNLTKSARKWAIDSSQKLPLGNVLKKFFRKMAGKTFEDLTSVATAMRRCWRVAD